MTGHQEEQLLKNLLTVVTVGKHGQNIFPLSPSAPLQCEIPFGSQLVKKSLGKEIIKTNFLLLSKSCLKRR